MVGSRVSLGAHKGRYTAHNHEMLAAIDLALKERPQKSEISIADLARLVTPKYLAVGAYKLTTFIRHGMTPEERKERGIQETRRVARIEEQ